MTERSHGRKSSCVNHRFRLAVAAGLTCGVSSLASGQSCEPDTLFGPETRFEAGIVPLEITSGDLDGDGDRDLVVAQSVGNDADVLLNNGDATFAPPISFDVGSGPKNVSLGDLDGDGDLDIAVASRFDHGISVLPNNGDATFAPQTLFRTGFEPQEVALGDLDGDGDLDMAAANEGGSFDGDVSVLLNNGDGTFASESRFDAGDEPSGIDVGDLDGDGQLDIVVSNSRSDDVSVLLNSGGGTFSSETRFEVGNRPLGVRIGDFDGDGNADVAAVNAQFGTVSILLNQGDGQGAFDPPTSLDTGDSSYDLALGDLDLDGDLDIAVANRGNPGDASVLLNNGDGTFAAQVRFDAGEIPEGVALSDLDDDGDLDMAVANTGFSQGDVSVLLNQCGGDPTCPADLTGPGGDGVPDGALTADDFFFYLGLFAEGDLAADLTGPGGDGEPDGDLTADDFFFYLGLFAQGCP